MFSYVCLFLGRQRPPEGAAAARANARPSEPGSVRFGSQGKRFARFAVRALRKKNRFARIAVRAVRRKSRFAQFARFARFARFAQFARFVVRECRGQPLTVRFAAIPEPRSSRQDARTDCFCRGALFGNADFFRTAAWQKWSRCFQEVNTRISRGQKNKHPESAGFKKTK